ncbi:TIGR03759 family integrating conjugative element protein [Methylohalobius crimeensis]|uniref:TIGR03759 family integrating conjugative element protein n=1 Tax=Methylohalobius crimeensis TaxID=244365 RepID=UPI0003B5E0AE|nr:TIGR03759 family integrating conjugative element protein [Methylohalobius crimeensis]
MFARKITPLLLAASLNGTVSADESADTRFTDIRQAPLHQSRVRTAKTAQAPTRFSREMWNLSEKEWARYEHLMRGIRSAVSPANLSPVEVLGIHAESEAERRKYARMWARMMREDTRRILAFQRAYDEAWREMNPSGEIVDVDRLPGREQALKRGDRLLFFTRLECPDCDADLRSLELLAQGMDLQLDVYFVDRPDAARIGTWAKHAGLDRDRLERGKTTLNRDRKLLVRLLGPAATVPRALRIREGRIDQLEL